LLIQIPLLAASGLHAKNLRVGLTLSWVFFLQVGVYKKLVQFMVIFLLVQKLLSFMKSLQLIGLHLHI